MKRIDDESWLDALGDPRSAVSLPLWGHHTVPAAWRVTAMLAEHLVYLVVSGAAEGMVSGGVGRTRVSLGPGTVLWAAPGQVVMFGLKRGAKPITLYRFRLRVELDGEDLRTRRSVVLLRHGWSMRPTFHDLLDELAAPRPLAGRRVRGLLQSLFVQLIRLEKQSDAGAATLTPGQLQRLTELVDADPAARLTPADLAGRLRLSHDYFTRVFRATTRLSPRRWLVERRVRRAAHHLLDTGHSVSEVAEAFGYPDVYLFSRQFKDVMGASPRDYRRGKG